MKKIFIFILTLIIALTLTACVNQKGSDTKVPIEPESGSNGVTHSPMDIELLAGPSGTISYIATAIGEVITNKSNWIRMSAIGTAATEANITQMLEKNDRTYTVFMASAATFRGAKNGAAAFEGEDPVKDMRLIGGFSFGTNGFCTINSNIKSLKDLNGKTVAMVSDSLPLTVCKQMFKNMGIDVKIEIMGFSDQFDALGDGLVDACMYFGTMSTNIDKPLIPVSALQEVVATRKNQVWAIDIPPELITQAVVDVGFEEFWPYVPVVAVPGSLSSAQTKPFGVYGAVTGSLVCWADMDDDVVYEITKTLCENIEHLGDYYNDLKHLDADTMVSMLSAIADNESDIHPGAIKYFQETGLWDNFEDGSFN